MIQHPVQIALSPENQASSVACSGFRLYNDRFEKLVQDLKDALGPSSGLTSGDVDLGHLTHLMEQYDHADKGWRPYFLGDVEKPYTRNLVDEGNGKSNLLVLVWSPGRSSPIHDHGNAHCLMKILKGNLTETRYEFPEQDGEEKPMKKISERVHPAGAVAYMSDDLGVHSMANNDNDFVVSIHLYTPPNVARGGCHVFDEETSTKKHVEKCGYHSVYGRLV